MKKLILSCAVAVLLASLGSCQQQQAAAPQPVVIDPNKPETPDPNKCYEGEVVFADCPSYIWISVKNGNIGFDTRDPLKGDDDKPVLKNTIAISNSYLVKEFLSYQEWKNGTKVYFKLDTQNTNPYSCLGGNRDCPGLSGSLLPKNVFCASSLSLTKCN